MIWGNKRIKKMLDDGLIEHSDEQFINPASINLRLGNTFLVPDERQKVELGSEMKYKRFEVHSVVIPPKFFILATTQECVSVPVNCAAFVQGRSSIGRIGLMVQNAGFVDPGFHGHITLELKNDSPCHIVLKAGYPVAQLVFMDAADVSRGYSGKYNGQIEATGSRMYLDNI